MVEINGMKFPTDRRYYVKDSAHIWLKEEGEHIRIGMDAFASEMVGLLTYLSVDRKLTGKGEAIGSFEAAKFVSWLYSPVGGEVVSVNDEVINNPRLINDDPYRSWIAEIKPLIEEEEEDVIEKKRYLNGYRRKLRG